MELSELIYAPLDRLRRYVGTVSWGPLVSSSRRLIVYTLQSVESGHLKIVDVDGQELSFGKSSNGPNSELTVHKEAFWVRMMLFTDMGFAESYLLGEVSSPDLTSFFELFIVNRKQLGNGTTITSTISSTISGLARSTNTLSNARLNISAHYDISNEMFNAFLSKDMTYSCPIWLPKSHPKAPMETLEDAQHRKLHTVLSNAHIKPTDHVLEIGTGWGSFAIAAVRETGCRVTSITLSKEQKELAEKKIEEAGFTDNIEILLCDYRALPMPKEGRYDKIVSIEMLEAVGKEYLTLYFECVDKLLKQDGGIAVFQCITMPETRYDAYQSTTDFIRKYIFPGGHLPTVSQLVASVTRGSKNNLIIESITNIGAHYARTLRIWRENFNTHFESRIKPALLAEHEGMTRKDVELFRRKWEYYFTYCEAGFRTASLGDVIVTCAREGSVELAEDVAL